MPPDQYSSFVAELPGLTKFARFLTGDAQMADDLVQDSLVRAMGAFDQKQADTSLRAWLFTILRNRHIDLRRRLKKQPDKGDLDDRSMAVAASDQVGSASFLYDLERAFARLPGELREVMWLVGVEGLSYAEAAEVTGVPTGTIRSRMFRAREALKEHMKDYWVAENGGAPASG